jgi:hypothetical protein
MDLVRRYLRRMCKQRWAHEGLPGRCLSKILVSSSWPDDSASGAVFGSRRLSLSLCRRVVQLAIFIASTTRCIAVPLRNQSTGEDTKNNGGVLPTVINDLETGYERIPKFLDSYSSAHADYNHRAWIFV